MKAKIAVLAGDGVGREIVPEAVKVLQAIGEKYQHTFEFTSADIGGRLFVDSALDGAILKLATSTGAEGFTISTTGRLTWSPRVARSPNPSRACAARRTAQAHETEAATRALVAQPPRDTRRRE